MLKVFWVIVVVVGLYFILSKDDQSQLKRDIQSSWVVNELVDLKTNKPIQMGLNLFSIEADGVCVVPAMLFEKRSQAYWSLYKKDNGNVILTIDCPSTPVFTGKYTVGFRIDQGLKTLTLRSATIKMTRQSQF